MKTRRNQLVAIALFSLMILGGNVSAKETELNVSSHGNAEEPALLVEDWMISTNYWNTTDVVLDKSDATEESLKLESWMTDENYWKVESVISEETDTEPALVLEQWMVNKNVWK